MILRLEELDCKLTQGEFVFRKSQKVIQIHCKVVIVRFSYLLKLQSTDK